MKKIIVLMLIFTMIFSVSVSATSINAGGENVVVSGIAGGGANVAVYAIDKSITLQDAIANGEFAHIGQTKSNSDGVYSYKFNIGNPDDYSYYAKAENQEALMGVQASVVSDKLYNFSFVIGNTTGTGKNTIYAKIDNLYDNASEKTVVVAYYDSSKRLLGTEIHKTNISYNGAELTYETELPKGTTTVKGFLWGSVESAIPMYECVSNSVGTQNIFKNGQTIDLIGDSITHMGWYKAFVDHYYKTRYPDNDITINNRGANGDTAYLVSTRMDRDILSDNPDQATIMLGMNDSSYTNYTPATKETYISNYSKILDRLKEKNVDITIITPSIYDTGNYKDATQNNIKTMDEILSGFGEAAKDMSAKYNTKLVDLWQPMYDKTREIRNEELSHSSTASLDEMVSNNAMLNTDRIHPNSYGSAFMAFEILKQQGVPSTVADVNVDLASKHITYQNAIVSNAVFDADGVSYDYHPMSEPLAYTEQYKKLENEWNVDVTNTLNKEMITVDGLSDGTYSIYFDGKVVFEATAAQLAEGVNIATLDFNPNQARAMQSYKILAPRPATNYQPLDCEYSLRDIQTYYKMYGIPLITDVIDNQKYLEYTTEDTANSLAEACKADYPKVLTKMKNIQNYTDEYNQIQKEAKKLAKPVAYKVTIKKAK